MQENEGEGILHLSAATNSAKTSGTLACGVEGFKQFGIDLIVVAVPGLPIKPGWTHDAALLGLNLTSNASNRALAWLENKNMLSREEHAGAKDALKWAARTYLVAAIGALSTLMYFIFRFLNSNK